MLWTTHTAALLPGLACIMSTWSYTYLTRHELKGPRGLRLQGVQLQIFRVLLLGIITLRMALPIKGKLNSGPALFTTLSSQPAQLSFPAPCLAHAHCVLP